MRPGSVAAFCLLSGSAPGQRTARNPKIGQKMCGQLAAMAPAEVEPLRRAAVAME
jgi:hypothetical protein